MAVFAAANRETTELPTLPEADVAKTLVRTTDPEAVRDHLQEFVETNADA